MLKAKAVEILTLFKSKEKELDEAIKTQQFFVEIQKWSDHSEGKTVKKQTKFFVRVYEVKNGIVSYQYVKEGGSRIEASRNPIKEFLEKHSESTESDFTDCYKNNLLVWFKHADNGKVRD